MINDLLLETSLNVNRINIHNKIVGHCKARWNFCLNWHAELGWPNQDVPVLFFKTQKNVLNYILRRCMSKIIEFLWGFWSVKFMNKHYPVTIARKDTYHRFSRPHSVRWYHTPLHGTRHSKYSTSNMDSTATKIMVNQAMEIYCSKDIKSALLYAIAHKSLSPC